MVSSHRLDLGSDYEKRHGYRQLPTPAPSSAALNRSEPVEARQVRARGPGGRGSPLWPRRPHQVLTNCTRRHATAQSSIRGTMVESTESRSSACTDRAQGQRLLGGDTVVSPPKPAKVCLAPGEAVRGLPEPSGARLLLADPITLHTDLTSGGIIGPPQKD